MKILFFSDHFRPEPSAPAAHVYERAKLWAQGGHDVTVVTSAPNFPEGRVYPGYRNRVRAVDEMDGIRVVRVWTVIARNEGFLLRTIDYMSYMVSAFIQAFRERKPDVVISTSPHIFVPIAGVAYAWIRRVPHVVEVRDLWPASITSTVSLRRGFLYRVLENVELAIYRYSARIVALTSAFKADMAARGVSADKIDVVINGTDLGLFGPRAADEKVLESTGLRGRFVVGYLGTIGMAHGLENVLHAANLLRDEPISFLFVGVGAAKPGLEQLAAELRLPNVVFLPRQLKEDMPRFWSVCDAGLVHLKDDPLFSTVIPSKIFESMAMGLPVIFVGPEGEGSRIVSAHDAGVVVPPAQPRALADAVMRLRNDSERMRELAKNSTNAAPMYSRERQAKETLRVLMRA